ncbi:MAG: nicotinate phosphoribosyltransferase [Myxococcaceae bacterium]|nr:MAG: nicotinate phosphoribosyltransferase [Myxococcaceae bacterium]
MSQSLLATDGYKFSMAEAGWPLRKETFYYSHRKGGPQVMPLDLEAYVRRLLPVPRPEDYAFLAQHDYEMGVGFKAAILRTDRFTVRAVPRGAVFLPREPILTLTGPSALVSWLEPLLLQLNYRIQVATQALQDPEALSRSLTTVTCEEEKRIALETLDQVGVKPFPIRVDTEGYLQRVRAQVKELVDLVEDPARIFEVGLRAATCLEQHELALRACQDAGVQRTSNVEGARVLGMIPVGTMGHEHVQRYGSDDDSGNKKLQYLYAVTRARDMGIKPVLILEDGLDAQMTREFEELRRQVGWEPTAQFYGYGGHIVARTMSHAMTRDKVAAVYKLSCTGASPVMKFGNELTEGKQSVPGTPIIFRRRTGGSGPLGLVGQAGETTPQGYFPLMESEAVTPSLSVAEGVAPEEQRIGYTATTQALVDSLTRRHFPQGR